MSMRLLTMCVMWMSSIGTSLCLLIGSSRILCDTIYPDRSIKLHLPNVSMYICGYMRNMYLLITRCLVMLPYNIQIIHTVGYMYVRMYVRTCVRTCMCACMLACMIACVRTCVRACMHVCMYVYVCMYVPTYI